MKVIGSFIKKVLDLNLQGDKSNTSMSDLNISIKNKKIKNSFNQLFLIT